MTLEEFKKRIDEMYEKYGGKIKVEIELTTNEEEDELLFIDEEEKALFTENIQDITEVKNTKYEVIGITISNYVMENNNWGQQE